MADKKISQLTAATTPLGGTEVLPIVQSGSTVKVSVDNLTTGKAVTVGSLSSSGALSGTALTATGNVNLDGGTLTFNDSGADKDARFEGDTDANLLFTDASADSVGVGTNTPAYKFDVLNPGSSSIARFKNGSGRGYVRFDGKDDLTVELYRNGVSVGAIGTDGSGTELLMGTIASNLFSLYTNNTVRLTIAGAGNVTFNTGNLVQGTAAKGINFTANTPAAGMTSQLLNWYEEGTWTPSDQSGAGLSLTITKAVYQRTGNQVTAFCYITYPSTANTSLTKVGGLPFTVGTNMYMPLSVAGDTGLALYGYTLSATTNFQFVTSSNVGITNNQLSGKFLILTIIYFV